RAPQHGDFVRFIEEIILWPWNANYLQLFWSRSDGLRSTSDRGRGSRVAYNTAREGIVARWKPRTSIALNSVKLPYSV
ncbi:MAG TPA: hypothetical protein VIH42_04375, partial [Thermoguttaceae bacterium]